MAELTYEEELIVSFHEDNKRGIAKTNDIIKKDDQKFVPVFADCILSRDHEDYVVKVLIQRGLQLFPLDMPAKKCKDIFVVPKAGIEQLLIGYCNDYISNDRIACELYRFVKRENRCESACFVVKYV